MTLSRPRSCITERQTPFTCLSRHPHPTRWNSHHLLLVRTLQKTPHQQHASRPMRCSDINCECSLINVPCSIACKQQHRFDLSNPHGKELYEILRQITTGWPAAYTGSSGQHCGRHQRPCSLAPRHAILLANETKSLDAASHQSPSAYLHPCQPSRQCEPDPCPGVEGSTLSGCRWQESGQKTAASTDVHVGVLIRSS